MAKTGPGASAYRWAFSLPPFTFSNCGGAPRSRPAVAWSLALVLPGVWLRGYAAGYVKKNRELTQTGPLRVHPQPALPWLHADCRRLCRGLAQWPVALVLAAGFGVIYVPVIASEERFLRATFPGFDQYCRRVPRLVPRLTPAKTEAEAGSFSFSLYLRHREYNAAIGAALLYLSLLFLRPALAAVIHVAR